MPTSTTARAASQRLSFTQAKLRDLPIPLKGEATYHDDEVHGLSVRVAASGSKRFSILKRLNGRPVRVTIGRFPAINVETARRLARKRIGEMADGKNPSEAKRKAREKEARRKTLATLFEEYQKARSAKLRERTLKEYARIVDNQLAGIKRTAVEDITSEDVERVFEHITKANGQASANGAMRLLRAVLNFGEVEPNPVRRLSRAKRWHLVERRKTQIAATDLAGWWNAVEELAGSKSGNMQRDFLLVLLLTGLRKMEAATLRVHDVDLDARTLTVADTKNRQPHILPLGRYLNQIIERRVQGASSTGWLFPSPEGGHLVDPRRAIGKATETSGVQFMPHDLRRTFSTVAESLNVGYLTLKRLLNHRIGQQDVTAGYVVPSVEDLRGPMQRIEDEMLSRAGITPSAKIVPLHKLAKGR